MTPEISGYTFTEQLLDHDLAGVWRGRTVTGMEVVALVLSEAGATDQAVRDRLTAASRAAALTPGRLDAPLWDANLTATRPYAVTQLAPGHSGAERLLDPLDGVFGNDQSAIAEVRRKLGAATAPTAAPVADPAQAMFEAAGLDTSPSRRRYHLAMLVVPFLMFLVTYQIGAAVNSAAARTDPGSPSRPVPDAVQPSPLPTKKVLLPGIPKSAPAPPRTGIPPVTLVGAPRRGQSSTDTFDELGLPFAVHTPGRDWTQVILEESSFSIYRRLLDGEPGNAGVDVWIAAHPCKDLATCLAQRAEFDGRWTKRTHATPPATAKDAQTWYSETRSNGAVRYQLTMTRAFRSPATGSWWLVGVKAAAIPGAVLTAQDVVNDIRTQTS
ncbi:MAG TPA: hypothetical protein VGJ44_12080 [Kribbellaceae bacterium]